MQVAKIVRVYSDRLPFYREYSDRLKRLLEVILAEESLKGYVECREKSPQSFREKLGRPGKSYKEPLREITDLVGARIICPDGHTVDLVCHAISLHFEIDEAQSVDKRRVLDSDRFGYSSVHLIVRPAAARRDLPEWREYIGHPAEIQVRTVLAHAWAMLSHSALYKRESQAPVVIVRRLARLAALLEVADEEVKTVSQLHDAAAARVANRVGALDFELPLDVMTLQAYLRRAPILERLRELAGPHPPGPALRGLAQLFHLAVGLRLTTLGTLDRALNEAILDESTLRLFFLDPRVQSYTADSAHLALLTLLFQSLGDLQAGWLESHLNWQKSFVKSVVAATAAARRGRLGA